MIQHTPRRVTALPHPKVVGWSPNAPDPKAVAFNLCEVATAIQTRYATDAHILPYSPDGDHITAMPRLLIEALGELQGQGNEPKMSAIFVDIDRDPHTAWPDPEDCLTAIAVLLAQGGHFQEAAYYGTKNGLRIVWALQPRVPVSAFREWASEFLDAVVAPVFEKRGPYADTVLGQLKLDRTCLDWWRCYRAPFVVRDGVMQKPSHYLKPLVEGATLTWRGEASIESVPVECVLSRVKFRGDAPANVEPLSRHLWDLISGFSFDTYEKLSNNQVLAPEGERTNALKRVIAQVASALGPETCDPEVYYAAVVGSVEADASPGAPTEAEAWRLCCYFASREADNLVQKGKNPRLGKAIENFVPIRAEDVARTVEQGRETRLSRPSLVRDYPEDGTLPPYSGAEPAQGHQPPLVLVDPSVYVYDGAINAYRGPYSGQGVYSVLRDYRPDINYLTHKGALVPVTRLLVTHGSTAKGVINVAYGPTGFDKESEILAVPACKLAEVRPEPNDDVARWLELLAGDHLDQLLDWIATADRLDWPTPALYLQGSGSAGKGLFASVVASLWGQEVVPFSEAIGKFNYRLTRSPVAFIDEGIAMGNGLSAIFRSFVAEGTHRIEDKWVKTQTLKAYLRLVISANNSDALSLEGVHSSDDHAAIAMRIFHVPVSEEPGDYLLALGGRKVTESWVGPDGKATRHFKWLQATRGRQVVPGGRFLINPQQTDFHEGLLVNSPLQHRVIMAIATTHMIGGGGDYGVYPGMTTDHQPIVDINVSKLLAGWKMLLPADKDVPSHYELSSALKTLSFERESRVIRVGRGNAKNNARCWRVSAELIYRVAAENGIYGLEVLAKSLGVGVDFHQDEDTSQGG